MANMVFETLKTGKGQMTSCISQMKRVMKMKLVMYIVLYKIGNNTHKIFPLFQCSFVITYCSIVVSHMGQNFKER